MHSYLPHLLKSSANETVAARSTLVWVDVDESVTRQLKSAFSVVRRVLPLKNVSSTRSCVGWDMCCVSRTIVYRRECCFPCLIQSGVNREVANP
ncbi:hypothetical protein T265_06026 [Opisthorchis viverrini]|uniref:Uncharacterized protein n=1 Tax=Opisthorchis viverrini TaxID=6198 RepID=A0A074ZIK5_OPIVI|nr:hypothetical protein T265_06026 [Opisthorchis viverrini]KER26821.1 hypothetical protein T265_06026 [Opisthorchis viverrini]